MPAPEPDEQAQHLPRRERPQVGAAGDGHVGDSPRFLVVLIRVRLKPALRVVGAFDVVDDFAIVVPAEDVRAGTGEVQRPAESPRKRDVEGSHVAAGSLPRVHHAVHEQVSWIGVGDGLQVALVVAVADAEYLGDVPAEHPHAKEPDVVFPGPRGRMELILETCQTGRKVGGPCICRPLILGDG